MRITKDGSVFRIELDSQIQRFETRISFAVSCHDQMVRPRLEMECKSLTDLFVEILPHVQIEDLVGDNNIPLAARWERFRQIFRLLDAIVIRSSDPEVNRAIPDNLRATLAHWQTLREL